MAKQQGGANAGKQVAFLWARTLRGDAAVKLLKKFGLLEQCIDYACESMQVRGWERERGGDGFVGERGNKGLEVKRLCVFLCV